MNVACPECRSVFRIDPSKIPGSLVRARCAVCGGVITISRDGLQGMGADEFTPKPTPRTPLNFGTTPTPVIQHMAMPPAAPVPATRAQTPLSTPAAPTAPSFAPIRPPAPQASRSFPTPVVGPAPPTAQSSPMGPSFPPRPPGIPARPAGADSATSSMFARPATPAAQPFTRPIAPPAFANRPLPPAAPAASGGQSGAAPMMMPPRPAAPPMMAPISAPRPMVPAVPPMPAAPSSQPRPMAPPASVMPPGPSIPRPATPPATSGPRPSGARPINPFLANDPNAKARRLARALISDLISYFPQKKEEGLRDGTLKQLFREEIKKSYEEYVDQIGREFAETTSHFQDALNDILAGGHTIFSGGKSGVE